MRCTCSSEGLCMSGIVWLCYVPRSTFNSQYPFQQLGRELLIQALTQSCLLHHLCSGCCRDLTSFDLASRLLTEKPNSRFENFVHESVQLGSKATVSAGCIVGKGSVLGDRCSVKRSIIGSTCKLGNSVKIVSSIVMDDVIVEEGSHIQNSIICSGSHVQVCCAHVICSNMTCARSNSAV